MISGSYWPGDITWFRGLGDGKFAAGEILQDKDGKDLNAGGPWKNKNSPDMDSLAASPWLVDWDGDQDLDLLVGNIAGHVILIENEGDAKQPQFGRKQRLQVDGGDLNVGSDAGPTTADWDGDGRFDLIVGADDGRVVWYRNTGSGKSVELAPGQDLVEASGHQPLKHGTEPERSGNRAKVHCPDWNGDGLLDLLVGDFRSVQMPEPELTAEQRKQRDELQKQLRELSQLMSPLFQKQQEGELSKQEQKQLDEILAKNTEVWQELRPLQAEHRTAGFVWVHLRKPNGSGD